MLPPVQQVEARNVAPVVAAAVLVDVAHVVAAVPEEIAVGIERAAVALGGHEVVGGTVRIGQQHPAKIVGGHHLFIDVGSWVVKRHFHSALLL